MEERSQRIVESAVELAEKGGFEAVRLRDVAAHANVAMGTLYRRFRSKEDLLVAALEMQTAEFERRLAQRPPEGEDELERIVALFTIVSRGLFRRPNLARALLRAAACGEPELAKKVASYHARMESMVVAVLRDRPVAEGTAGPVAPEDGEVTERERKLATLLNQLWFSSMMGWMSGLHGQAAVVEQMQAFGEIILRGVGEE